MHSSITRVFIGGIAFLLLIIKQTAAHNCKSPYTDSKSGFQGVDCSKVLTGAVPEDLGNIAFLDISDNALSEISGKTFSNYASLRALVMQNVTSKDDKNVPIRIHENAFDPLQKLEFLDMTKTAVGSSNVKWPRTLKNLTIAECNFESLDVQNLIHLQSLNASKNKLKVFPNFDEYAHLISIDVRNNLIENISTKHISFYCNLEFFGLTYMNSPEETTNEDQYCNCANLLNWMDLYDIYPGSGGMNCSNFNSERLPSCREDLQSSLKERRLCLRRTQLEMTMGSRILLIFVLIILMVLLLIAAKYAKPVYMPKVADTHPFEHRDVQQAVIAEAMTIE